MMLQEEEARRLNESMRNGFRRLCDAREWTTNWSENTCWVSLMTERSGRACSIQFNYKIKNFSLILRESLPAR